MKSKEEVLALLLALGSTEEEIAAKLVSLGIRGDPKKYNTCPIAQYLISNGVEAGIGVGIGIKAGAGVVVGHNIHWYSLIDYPQLAVIFNFIWAFDRGDFPQCEIS
jgi:hypothetical protein